MTNTTNNTLTQSQQQAVDHVDGPLLVLAGPGSGKTRVITFRIANLLKHGVRPEQILALTSTNKAAREMAERVQHLLGGIKVRVSTFHRFCSRILRRWPERVGLKENFTILDQSDQTSVVRQVMKDLDLDTQIHEPGRVLSRISRARNDMVSAELFRTQFEQRAGSPMDAVVYQVFPEYEKRVRQQNAVGFDDLLLHVVHMLEEDEALREALDEQFQYILVDEYQDTNLAQYRIVHAMSRLYRNLCATGDPDQSIYGWRGARPANISAFERDFPERKVVTLDQNFRSTQRIVKCADRLISHNRRPHRGELTTENAEGDPVRLQIFEHGEAEADGVAADIAAQVASGKRKWNDFAIFYRVNALSRPVETALSRHQIPYQVASGYSFFERAEVRDLVAYLRLIENQSDDSALERIINRPARGIGNTTLLRLRNFAAKHNISVFDAAARNKEVTGLSARAKKALDSFVDLILKLHEQSAQGHVAPLIERLIFEIDYLSLWQEGGDEVDVDRAANVYELVSAARQYDSAAEERMSAGTEAADSDSDSELPNMSVMNSGVEDPPSLQGFLELATLSSEADSIDPRKGAVALMTLHASKGLEFPCVYIIGLESGLIPHERAVRDGDPGSFEEERRLLFVGITRAMEQLVLTQTAERIFRGTRRATISSPFVPELNGVVQREAGRQTAPAITEAMLDQRIGQARRRSEAAQSNRQRPLIMTGAELARRAMEPDGTDDSPALFAFQKGMQVRHPRYGRGTVTETSGASHRATVTVCFEGNGETHTFVASRCPLQPVGLT